MQAVAHNPEFAKKVGVPVSVGKEFVKEDKETDMKRYMKGGKMPSKPSLPSQASSKAASAMERFAGARGMLGGGSTKDPNPRKAGALYNLGTNQNPKMSAGGKTKKMAFGGMSSMPNSIKGVPPVPSYSPPIIPGSPADTGSAGSTPTPIPAGYDSNDSTKVTLRGSTPPTLPSKANPRAAAALAARQNKGRGMDMRRVPTLPAQASQRARDLMASRMPIRTPGGPAEITPETPPAMPQVETLPPAGGSGGYGLKVDGEDYKPITPPPVQIDFKKGGKTGTAKGGMTKSRMDGCATRGKTRGRMV